MRVIEQMLSRYAREEGHHALRGKQGHSLIFHLRGAPWAPWSTTERELGTAGTGDSPHISPHISSIFPERISGRWCPPMRSCRRKCAATFGRCLPALPHPLIFLAKANSLGVRDRVEYVASPSREELVRLYQEASVFALPSDEEGLGMVILEATSCAVPVVSTRSGGPDGIITDGEDGFLLPLDDAAAMAGRLQSLLENPSLNIAMGSKARATIEARHDERVAGAVFVEMWDRLTGQ